MCVCANGTRDPNELSGIFARLSLLFDVNSRTPSAGTRIASDEIRGKRRIFKEFTSRTKYNIGYIDWEYCVFEPRACFVSTLRLCHRHRYRNLQHSGLFDSLICVFCCRCFFLVRFSFAFFRPLSLLLWVSCVCRARARMCMLHISASYVTWFRLQVEHLRSVRCWQGYR